MRLVSKSEFLIVPKGTKFAGPGKLGLSHVQFGKSGVTHQELSKPFPLLEFTDNWKAQTAGNSNNWQNVNFP